MKLSPRRQTAVLALLIGAGSIFAAHPALAAKLDSALQTSERAASDTKASQQRIDKLDEQTQRLLNDYRANLKQLEQLKRYNDSQRRQVKAQEKELASLHADINNISSLQRSVQPLMEDMEAGLEKLVKADIPFLPDERQARIKRLRGIMDDPGKSPAQRYRLLVEAYQIENEYGRTLGAYRGDVSAGGSDYDNAQFLRIGRLALIFKTDDDAVLKIYDAQSDAWRDLDRGYLDDVKTALRLAREQIPPQLLTMPVRAPQSASVQPAPAGGQTEGAQGTGGNSQGDKAGDASSAAQQQG